MGDIERRQGAAPPKCSDPFAGEPEPDLRTVDALIDELERQAYASQIEERLAGVIVERRRGMPQLGPTRLFAAREGVPNQSGQSFSDLSQRFGAGRQIPGQARTPQSQAGRARSDTSTFSATRATDGRGDPKYHWIMRSPWLTVHAVTPTPKPSAVSGRKSAACSNSSQ